MWKVMVRNDIVVQGYFSNKFIQHFSVFYFFFVKFIILQHQLCKWSQLTSFISQYWESEIFKIINGDLKLLNLWGVFSDESEWWERTTVFVFVKLPLESFLITKVEFIHVFCFFEKVGFHHFESRFAFALWKFGRCEWHGD